MKRALFTLRALFALAPLVALARTAQAVPPPPPTPVDVALHEPPPPERVVSIEWNPVALVALGKISANAIVVPVDHHALALNLYYGQASTAPIWIFDDAGNPTQLPKQKFAGFGGELGYRYYTGLQGPRGLFVGPSLMLGSFTASAQNGTNTSYLQYGLALDVGYQMLVADTVSIALGAGAQVTLNSKSIPDQQWPAEVYANAGVRPRFLMSIGWAF